MHLITKCYHLDSETIVYQTLLLCSSMITPRIHSIGRDWEINYSCGNSGTFQIWKVCILPCSKVQVNLMNSLQCICHIVNHTDKTKWCRPNQTKLIVNKYQLFLFYDDSVVGKSNTFNSCETECQKPMCYRIWPFPQELVHSQLWGVECLWY